MVFKVLNSNPPHLAAVRESIVAHLFNEKSLFFFAWYLSPGRTEKFFCLQPWRAVAAHADNIDSDEAVYSMLKASIFVNGFTFNIYTVPFYQSS